MTKTGYFNDAPIRTPDDGRFGIDRLAQALAQSFKGIESPIGWKGERRKTARRDL